jgi:uncharacterized protein YndB with AHSA1/START domain
MKWIVIVVAVLIGLPALMALVGTLLPRDHVAGASIVVRQPPERVWAAVRDIGAVPQWWSELRSSERTAGPEGWEHWKQVAGGGAMTIVIEAAEPPRHLVTRIESPPGAPFGGSWTYEIAAVPEGSRVTVTERGWIANPLFRFLSRFVFGYYRTQESYLRALGGKFGETVEPVRVAGGS